ncbi:relaxase/mobilization nuclease domain-containing protein [Calothrix sp. CCY 0018]|uniref:relaxase/mobilization nuclease domain-containing protein n=1 Tax=Calothrix sp. CCY 0018 TaxID=3103864 RepID=UPI0039C70890
MIGNITKGNGFYGCVAYVLGKEDAQLVNSNMASNTPTDLAWEFRKFARLNQRVEKPVLHLSLSPAPGDRILDEWELCMIAQDLLEGLELSNNQFILVQHKDAEYDGKIRPHMHLVINRVSVNGKCNDDYLDYYRTEKLLRQIEKNYDLIPQPSSWEVEKKKAYPKHVEKAAGELNVVERLQNAIENAAADKPEMPVFVARLLKDNIQVNCKFTRTGKLKGISYCMDGEAFKGGDLGKLYTHIGIRKHLEVGYQQYYSDPISSLMESYKRGRTINDEWVDHLSYWCRSQNTDIEIAPQQVQLVEEKSIIPEISTHKSDDSTSTSESTTDNTSVVEPAQESYVSVVPSVEQTFGTYEDNKAKKKSNINEVVSNLEDKKPEAVTSPRPTYPSVVPPVEVVFPAPKVTSYEKNSINKPSDADSQIEPSEKSESSVHSIEEPLPQPAKLAPEPEAVEFAVKIAGYMGSTNQTEIKGDSMRANLSFDGDISTLEVRRIDTNEIILSANHSIYSGWVINNSLKFTEQEKKRIDRLKERTNVPIQQPVNEKKGFEQ